MQNWVFKPALPRHIFYLKKNDEKNMNKNFLIAQVNDAIWNYFF